LEDFAFGRAERFRGVFVAVAAEADADAGD